MGCTGTYSECFVVYQDLGMVHFLNWMNHWLHCTFFLSGILVLQLRRSKLIVFKPPCCCRGLTSFEEYLKEQDTKRSSS